MQRNESKSNRQRRQMFGAISAFLLASSAFTSSVFAWGEQGHETIGEIAERHLLPNAAASINDILGPESLAMTATWADQVREDGEFKNFAPYHFIKITTGTTYAKRPAAEKDPKDLVTVLTKYPELIKDPNTPRSVKMIALRYLVHIVGDVHQPLHVGNRFDIGGNACVVETAPGRTTNLHRLWDRGLIDDDMNRMKVLSGTTKRFYRYTEYADDILKANQLSAAELSKIRTSGYLEWIQESQDLRPLVYPDVKPTTDSKREYCQRNVDPKAIPVLSEAYKKQAMEIAQKQIFRAGLRLAEMLNQIFSGPSQPGTNVPRSKAEIFKELDLTN